MSDSPSAQKLSVSLDYRWISIGLVAVIAVMLFVWKPWGAKTSDRTIDVTGQTTVSARPDEFVFYPSYQFENSDKQTAVKQMTAKSNELVSALKKLGVPDKGIKTNSSSWSYPIYANGTESDPTYTLQLTVTVGSDDLAQKVQDYLLGTSPSGTVTPQANFSENKRKELENEARGKASQDARKKAEQSAENLGFKLGAVKAVNDGSGFGISYPATGYGFDMKVEDSARASMTIQPGENELSYSVTVTYYIR